MAAPCCHRRLVVVDPAGGRQPMTYKNLTIVYNGELYNTPELRTELQQLGYQFDGHGDTEVVLKSFHAWGEDCAKKFNGIFAYAVYNETTHQLFFARDPMGVKPLFYAVRGNTFLFASELKALLCHPLVQPEVDRLGLYDIFFLGPGRTPGRGIFRNVQEVLPGQCGQFDADGLRLHRYWQLHDAPCTDTFEQAVEKTRFLVTDAIERQLISDVPLCTFLSGGLDSSIISTVARQHIEDLTTYSVDYHDNDRYFQSGKFQPNSDNQYIEIMHQFLRSNHRRVELDTPELVLALFDAVNARDLPGMADVDASMLLLCQSVKHTHTVVLSGECADEIFGGYPWYRDPEVRERDRFPVGPDHGLPCHLPETGISAGGNAPGICPPPVSGNAGRNRHSAGHRCAGDAHEADDDAEPALVHADTARPQDRVSMYSGLEVRVPFCDKRIVEYLYTLPWSYKDYHGREKGLLRYAMRDLLPKQIVERKKSPYPKTWNPSYHQAVSKLLRSELSEPDSPLLQLCERSALEQLLQEQRSLPWYGQLMTTPQTIAYFLQISYWMRKYHVSIV